MEDKIKNNIYAHIYIITDNYINNIKNSINTSTNKKDIKKYTKWYIFIRYVLIVFTLYKCKYKNIDSFIKPTSLIRYTSNISSHNNTLQFYDIHIPNISVLHNIKKYLNNTDISYINDIIYADKTQKQLEKMIQYIYLIIYNDDIVCWQFKNDKEILKLTYISNDNLYIKYTDTDIYVYNCMEDNKKDDYSNINICDNEIIKYDYIYDMIKNTIILYLYIVTIIVKFYTNINIMKNDHIKHLLYIIKN